MDHISANGRNHQRMDSKKKGKKEMKKSCHNCQDYIVCYGFDEIKNDKGENCPDWQMDFLEFQKAQEANKEQNKETNKNEF